MADKDEKTKQVPMTERWEEEGAFPFEVEIERGEEAEEDEETEDEEYKD